MSGEMGQHRLKKVVDYSLLYDFSVLLILLLLSGALRVVTQKWPMGN